MSNGFREIRDTSPLSMKELNDQMRHLWTKVMGNLDSRDIKLGSLEEKNLSTEIVTKLGEISLMVTKDNIINSINLSTEGIAIDGTKVTINASNLDLSANQSIRLAVGQIGGVNLFKKTTSIAGYFCSIDRSGFNETENGFWAIGTQGNTALARVANVINKNGTYTISFYALSTTGAINLTVDVCDLGSKQFAVGQVWSKVIHTVNVTNYSSDIYNFVDIEFPYSYLYIKDLKIEEGGIATAWTPAREDIVNEIFVSTDGITLQGNKISVLGPTHIPNLTFDKLIGGTAKLGGLENGNGLLEVYNASGGLAARLNNAGLYAIAGTIGNFTITSSALTGGLIQTATAGGIKLNNADGLRVFDNQSTPKVRIQVLPNQANPTLVFYDNTGTGQHFTASYRPAQDGQMAGFYLSSTSSHDLFLFGRDVYAKSLIISSDINKKENIVPCSLDGIAEIIMNLQTYEYNLKEDDPNNKTIGIMAQESPQQILNMANNAVDIYAYPTLLLQAVQVLFNRVIALESKTA